MHHLERKTRSVRLLVTFAAVLALPVGCAATEEDGPADTSVDAVRESAAEGIFCNAMTIYASTSPDDEKHATTYETPLKIDLKHPTSLGFEGELAVGPDKLSALVLRDEHVRNLYELKLIFSRGADGETLSRDIGLLKYAGPSDGSFTGPEGASALSLLLSGSLQPAPAMLRLTSEAFTKLRPFGVTESRLANVFQIQDQVEKAIGQGVLKEGELIGSGLVFSCWRK